MDYHRWMAKDKLIATGGLIRSNQGVWIMGFTKCIGIGVPLMAEAWVLATGLEVAINMGLRKLEVEMDC